MSEQGHWLAGDTQQRPPLDDMMLAMDVVDTLRRRQRLVLKELDEAGREEDLKQRLKRIYNQQGIDVPDHVIEQGIAALKEDRFTYKPAPNSMVHKLARIYVSRSKWGKWLAGGFSAGLLALLLNYMVFVAPEKALPEELSQRFAEVLELSASDHARSTAQQILDTGMTALRNADNDSVKDALAGLDKLHNTLAQEYVIQIVNRPDERSGVWRIPDVNKVARNYYIIVEAINPAGKRLKQAIRNEETGETRQVMSWGLRVDEVTFNAVKSDKLDDGILENNRFGFKARGYINPQYKMSTTGGAITQW